jgi:hypothetical protein
MAVGQNITPPGPQPQGITPWMQQNGLPAIIFLQYTASLDLALRTLLNDFNGALIGPLTNATNDVNAAAAGVPINGLYRNGNAVQIRLT